MTPEELYHEKRAQILIQNLKKRHFDAYYCPDSKTALEKALTLIPEGSLVGWGGVKSAHQIGLISALNHGPYRTIDRDSMRTQAEREQAARDCLSADVFLTGANGLSMDGQMVTIDGNGNRAAAILFGPRQVLVIAGMNKVMDSLEDAVRRARTVAAPMNQQRFQGNTPCTTTGVCGDCKTENCICNQIVITRNCRPAGRITFLLVGENLGF